MEPSPKQGWDQAPAVVSAHQFGFIPHIFYRGAVMAILFFAATLPLLAATVNLREGTKVRLKLRHLITTENVSEDDKVSFEVVEDVVAEGQVVIAKGALAAGAVTRVKGAGNKKAKDASVTFRIMNVQSVENQGIGLRMVLQKGKKSGPADYEVEEESAIPGLAGRVVGAEQGREYTAYTDADYKIKIADAPPIAPIAAPAPPVVEPAEPANVDFNSEPSGAAIAIDGNPAGQSPATLPLAPGRHVIELRLANYRPWTRSMVVTPGSHPLIRAALEKE